MEDQSVTTRTVTNQAVPGGSAQQEVVSQSNSSESSTYVTSKLNQILWFVIGIFILFIAARFVFLLLGARNTEFVSFIYSVGKFLILPFTGIFTSPTFNGTSYFDTAAVVGIIAWIILGFVLSYLVTLFDKKSV